MAYSQRDSQLLESLRSAQLIFDRFVMPQTANHLRTMEQHLSSGNISKSMLYHFKNFQDLIVSEFGSNDHRKRLVNYFSKRIRSAMKTNATEVRRVVNDSSLVALIGDRINAFKILRMLNKVLQTGSTSPEERIVSLSFAYGYLVEGVYKKSVIDCYVWEKLGTGVRVDVSKLSNIDIKGVEVYYDNKGIDKTIFEGYNSTVRNAIGHATIYFEGATNEMRFEDKRAGKTEKYDYDHLVDLYSELENVFEMTVVKNQITMVNDICDAFIKRHATPP